MLDLERTIQEAVWSPDGEWLVLSPTPPPGGQRQVSSGGARSVSWSASGRQLYYVDGELNIVVAELLLEPSVSVGATTTLIPAQPVSRYALNPGFRQFVVSADGSRVLAIRLGEPGERVTAGRGNFVYVQNWLKELKQLVGN